MNYIKFNKLSINDTFVFGETIWCKQSTRTAHINGMPGRWFYFGKDDPCRYPTSREYKYGAFE